MTIKPTTPDYPWRKLAFFPNDGSSLVHLNLPEYLSFEDWQLQVSKLQDIYFAWQWWAGDLLNYGEDHYGENYAQAISEKFHRSLDTLTTAMWVCRHFPPHRRRADLTFTHHREVAGLNDPEVEDYLLGTAALNHWKIDDLRLAVREYRQAKLGALTRRDEEPPRSSLVIRAKCPQCEHEFDWSV